MAGVLAGLNGILVAFTVLSERTPTYLQAILHQLLIPFTAFARYVVLGAGKFYYAMVGSRPHHIAFDMGHVQCTGITHDHVVCFWAMWYAFLTKWYAL